MSSYGKLNRIELRRLVNPLLIVGPATSLAISPTFNFDPINLIKTLIYVSIAFYCVGILIANPNLLSQKLGKKFIVVCGIFILFLTVPLFFTSAPIDQQIWGNFGRNTGYLAYLSLLFLTIGSATIQNRNFYKKLNFSLIFTTIPMSIYCLIQIAKLDPFNWSTFDIFGTLGNANFLSAFLAMGAIACLVISFESGNTKINRISLVLISVVAFLITVRTNSIQGPLIYVAGTGISLFFYIRSNYRLRRFRYYYFLLGVLGFSLAISGLFNKGPLARIIFQPSVLYRADYMHAGWEMTKNHLLTGVGLDSYGDWYRESRGLISTTRTGPERTSNTAHNIFLDISSGGGIFLLLSYLAILSFAFFIALRHFKKISHFDPVFTSIFSIWCAYQIQSFISINQVGVGIWGWLLTGALIGYPRDNIQNEVLKNHSNRVKSKKTARAKSNKTLDAKTGISSFVMLVLGFILAFIPFNADHKYYSAYSARDLNAMMNAVKTLGSTSWHISQVIETSMKNNYVAQASEMDNYLLQRNPRDFFAWRVRYYLSTSTPDQKLEALKMLKKLDPYNPEIPKS